MLSGARFNAPERGAGIGTAVRLRVLHAVSSGSRPHRLLPFFGSRRAMLMNDTLDRMFSRMMAP